MKNCSNPIQLLSLADALIDGLKAELFLTPKPGLVDLRNNGSHPDLSLATMARSIALMRVYFKELCAALLSPSRRPDPVEIGQRAERRMFDALGTNCHKGGIFLCGLLLIAASRCDMRNPEAMRLEIGRAAEEIFADRDRLKGSHGDRIRRRHPQSGIVAEALAGLPGLFDRVLPCLLKERPDGRGMFMAMAELMLYVDDSTTRHRCGDQGLAILRDSGDRLKRCLLEDGDHIGLLIDLDERFQQANLTMGGVADLLGVGLGYAAYLQSGQQPLPASQHPAAHQHIAPPVFLNFPS